MVAVLVGPAGFDDEPQAKTERARRPAAKKRTWELRSRRFSMVPQGKNSVLWVRAKVAFAACTQQLGCAPENVRNPSAMAAPLNGRW